MKRNSTLLESEKRKITSRGVYTGRGATCYLKTRSRSFPGVCTLEVLSTSHSSCKTARAWNPPQRQTLLFQVEETCVEGVVSSFACREAAEAPPP